MNCPKCVGKLQRKNISTFETSEVKELQGAVMNYELEIDQCFSCGGVWFDKGELNKYLTEEMELINAPSLGKEIDKHLDQKEGLCPRCGIHLVKRTAEIDRHVMIDFCDKCNGIWLDTTEIDQLEKSSKQRNRQSLLQQLITATILKRNQDRGAMGVKS